MASLPILTFHSIDDQNSVLSFPSRLFEYCLALAHQRGHATLNLLDVVRHLSDGTRLPPKSLVITFDDGYRSVYDCSFPILQRYQMTATVFLTVGENKATQANDRLPSMEGRAILSWSEIREMQRAGIGFGAHTLTHSDLTRLPSNQIEKEMRESKDVIEQQTGTRVDSFAYPFGKHNAQCRSIARQYFSNACTDRLGLIQSKSDPYALERVDAYYLRTKEALNLLFSPFFPAYIRAFSIPRNIRRAIWRTPIQTQ